MRAFGAVGDGIANDTAPVQRALDACHAAGGGRVVLGPGVYVCGTLDVKSHTELFLAAGAVLRGSPRRDDYTTAGNAAYDKSRAHFIRAVGAAHIAIRGPGIIDGNGAAFFGPPRADHPLRRFRMPDWRPGHMLAFCECRDVAIANVHLLNATTYTIWPFACERVRIQGVTIRNPPETPNGDGIDPTACRDVLISQCFIETGDDCIALYSGPANGTFGAEARPCENVIITNCVLRSACTAIRLGPHGDGPIRHCVISDLVIKAGGSGIGMHAFAFGGKCAGTIYESVAGPQIEDIQVRQISICAECSPLFMQIHPDSRPPAGIRDICLRGAYLESPGAVCVVGCEQTPVAGLELSDIVMHAGKPTGAFSAQVPDPVDKLSSRVCLGISHAFYLRHVRDACLRHLRVYGTGTDTGRRALAVEQSLAVTAEDVTER